jgi:ABC-2 type transport system permease protein
MTNTLAAEIKKLRYTRSLWLLAAFGVVISAAAATVMMTSFKAVDIADRLSDHGPLRFGPTNLGLILIIFGVRIVADETHHHTLASTFVGTPDRRRVLAAKAVVAMAVAVAVCVAIYALVLPVTLVALEARGLTMTLDWAATAELFARAVAAMALFAVLGVGIAATIRNRAVALVGILIWLAFAEDIVGGLLHIGRYLPAAATQALGYGGGADALAAPLAAGVLVACTVGALASAVIALRQDID